jgi:hypothetical protein
MHARQAAHTVPPPAGPGRAAPLPVGSAGRDPQYVGPAVVFQVLTQLGARAVHLIAADEVQPHPVSEGLGEDVDGQLPLGAEDQALRHAHDRRFHRITDVIGRDPFPRADQRVPGAFPHIGQVHGIDPVGQLADAAQVLPLYPGGQLARLDLAGFVDRAHRQAAPPSGRAGSLIQPGHGKPAHHPHRRDGVPHRAAEQPLGLVRRTISDLRRDGPPVAPGDLARHGGRVLARLQPRPGPRETRP